MSGAATAEPRSETGLFLEGLRCTGCVHRVERALREVPGVEEAQANYTTHRALVRFDPSRTDPASLVAAVVELGYAAVAYDPAALERAGDRDARRALVRLLVAAFLAANVMLVALALYIGGYQDIDAATRRGLRWLAIGLALPSVAWCALPFWRGAWSGLRRGEITMDVPVALGVAVSFAVSIAGTLGEAPHLYLDSAAMIVFLILLGRTLERRARARAAGAVERLAAATPSTALLRSPEGLREVPVEALRRGDRVVVPTGQRVPTDGRILRGSTELDESLLTGESLPVLREPGSALAGGTCNVLGEIEMQVEAPAAEGTAARLAALLERAQSQRPRLQRSADAIAAVFAPAIVAVALATAAGWWLAGAGPLETALAAAAVLIVACPCALGLATPAAVTAAIGRAAGLGVVVRSGEALERCARVERAVLDKTGTLSEGRLRVAALEVAPGASAEELLVCATRAEGASTHPVAAALRRECAERALDVASDATPRAVAGRGVIAPVDGEMLRVGSLAFLEDAGVAPAPALARAGAKLAAEGRSLAWVARDARVLGVIGLADPLRADARAAVTRLRRLGLGVEIVSGDHPAAVARVAREAGVDAWIAGASPEAKLARIRERREAGDRILAAGDGINDAAALSAADVGAAMARGSDVTLHVADLVIRAPRLGALADAVELSRVTLRRIRQNLGFALIYNAVAIPLAVSGVLQPLQAAVAMSLSSLVVTGNAVRLLGWRPRR